MYFSIKEFVFCIYFHAFLLIFAQMKCLLQFATKNSLQCNGVNSPRKHNKTRSKNYFMQEHLLYEINSKT
jgi:hypothetical protein